MICGMHAACVACVCRVCSDCSDATAVKTAAQTPFSLALLCCTLCLVQRFVLSGLKSLESIEQENIVNFSCGIFMSLFLKNLAIENL